MGYEAKLSLKQAPVLALNAVLLQAIKLLPMACQEVVDAIQQELKENPMLKEVVVKVDGDPPTAEQGAPDPADAADAVKDGAERYDIDWAAYFPEEWEGLRRVRRAPRLREPRVHAPDSPGVPAHAAPDGHR